MQPELRTFAAKVSSGSAADSRVSRKPGSASGFRPRMEQKPSSPVKAAAAASSNTAAPARAVARSAQAAEPQSSLEQSAARRVVAALAANVAAASGSVAAPPPAQPVQPTIIELSPEPEPRPQPVHAAAAAPPAGRNAKAVPLSAKPQHPCCPAPKPAKLAVSSFPPIVLPRAPAPAERPVAPTRAPAQPHPAAGVSATATPSAAASVPSQHDGGWHVRAKNVGGSGAASAKEAASTNEGGRALELDREAAWAAPEAQAAEAAEWAARQAVIAAQAEEARRLKVQRRVVTAAERRAQVRLLFPGCQACEQLRQFRRLRRANAVICLREQSPFVIFCQCSVCRCSTSQT